MGKGFDVKEIDNLKGRVLIAGHCAVEEISPKLIKRLGRKNVYLSGECNDLCSTAEAMFHLMKVNPVTLSLSKFPNVNTRPYAGQVKRLKFQSAGFVVTYTEKSVTTCVWQKN